jgi:CheY-like chemotaxis protein
MVRDGDAAVHREEPIMPRSRQKAAAAVRGPLRILVAEDNGVLRASIRGLLGGLGHRVEAVADGEAAIEAAAGSRFDLIILDIQMPGVGGIEAAEAIRRGRPSRIVGISAERVGREALRASGFDDFLDKPVRIGDLVRVCEDVAPAAGDGDVAGDFESYTWGVGHPSEGEFRVVTNPR